MIESLIETCEGSRAMSRVIRNISCGVFLITAFLVHGEATKLGALNHGYACAAYCDDHTGNQCPDPPPAWFSCVGDCLYSECNGNEQCIDNGIPEAAEWCAFA